MAGRTEYGPVPYVVTGAPMVPKPVLVTSMTEYERAFGGLSIGGVGQGNECQDGGRIESERVRLGRAFPVAARARLD